VIKTFAVTGLALVSAFTLSGCGSGQEGEARSAAQRFYAAVADHDGAAACALLSTRTRSAVEKSAGRACATAVLQESLPQVGQPRQVNAYGTMAQVRFAGDTAFLSRYGDRWLVVAAGCTPPPRRTAVYDCQISGG
jgi:uncharacterized lipoprotein NlpE involved in copper resistance